MEVKITEDGSITIYSSIFNQHYHSKFGAKTESLRVFIELGLEYIAKAYNEIKILEIGFGSGLNTLLSDEWANNFVREVHYTGLEPLPLDEKILVNLPENQKRYHKLDTGEWHKLNSFFNFRVFHQKLEDFEPKEKFNLVYFDAFDPESQPNLWNRDIFEKINLILESGGILTTYCSKSMVQKNIREAGFKIEKHQGPPHKREVLRAIKV